MTPPTTDQLAALSRFRLQPGGDGISVVCQDCHNRSGSTRSPGALLVMALGHTCPTGAEGSGR